MRKILLLLLFISCSVNAQNFNKEWEKIDNFEKDGRIKSANTIVESIYKKAKKHHNDSQLIKALLFQVKYAATLEEDAATVTRKNLKAELGHKNIATRSILYCMYAKFLKHQDNYIYTAVDTTMAITDSVAVETPVPAATESNYENTEAEITKAFEASIANEEALSKIPFSNYKDLLGPYLHLAEGMSLYDFLLSEYIYETADELYNYEVVDPAYIKKLLGSSTTFTGIPITEIDSSQSGIVTLLQKKENRLIKAGNNVRLRRAALERILLVYNNLHPDDDLFMDALRQFIEESNDDNNQLAKFELANQYHLLASREKHPDYRIKAMAIAEEILNGKDIENIHVRAKEFKTILSSKIVSIRSVQYVAPDENNRALIDYRNTKKLFFRAYKVPIGTNHDTLMEEVKDSIALDYISKKHFIYEQEYALPERTDYLNHSTEIVLPAFEKGKYLLIFSYDNEFKHISAELIQATHLVINTNTIDNTIHIQALDRKTGKPLPNATVKMEDSILLTDKDGMTSYLKNPDKRYQNRMYVIHQNDTIVQNLNYYDYYGYSDSIEENSKKLKAKVTLFSDREIYRPGQTVYFKGILVQTSDNQNQVVPNQFVKIEVKDDNDKVFEKLELHTNEFGSFNGSFVLPSEINTGDFIIEIQQQQQYENTNASLDHFWEKVEGFYTEQLYLTVEEYKRPKFEVKLLPVTEAYALGDTIKIKGNSKNFSGAAVSGAKVVYSVKRNLSFNFIRNENTDDYDYDRSNYFEANPIANGEVITDKDGNFEIEFTATPDPRAKQKYLPRFNFSIEAAITDISGETQKAERDLKISFDKFHLSAGIPEKIDTSSKTEITLKSENLNEAFVPVNATVKIYKLKSPDRILKSRLWEAPEIQTIPEAEFVKLFPYEPYQDKKTEQENEVLVFTKEVNTAKDKKIALPDISKWKSGDYRLVFAVNDTLERTSESKFYVCNTSEKQITDNHLFQYSTTNKGKIIELQLSSAAALSINIEAFMEGNSIYRKIIPVNNAFVTTAIPTGNHHESVNLRIDYIWENESFSHQEYIFPEKEEETLTIETGTFRSKIQPGASETWSFSVKNKDGINRPTEVLASMYDSSLDQFKFGFWDTDILPYPDYYRAPEKNSDSFGTRYGRIIDYSGYPPPPALSGINSLFNWFGIFPHSYNVDEVVFVKSVAARDIKGTPYGFFSADESNDYNFAYGREQISGNGRSNLVAAASLTRYGGNVKYDAVVAEINSSGIPDELDPLQRGRKGINAVRIRKNFNETAFFLPNINTDKNGNLSFRFNTPEALTSWKLRMFAHDKNLETAYREETVITQQDLMISPNFPRFFREKDTVTVVAKVSNLSNTSKTGIATLQLFDAANMQPVDAKTLNLENTRKFTVNASGNTSISWKIAIPEGLQGIQYKVTAVAGNFSDGEENIIPVLPNNILVTESIPLWVRENTTKNFLLPNLKNSTSSTLHHQSLTLEYTSNPTWLAIQSLPYLMEYEHDCAEQTFARFYANALASKIITDNPKIAAVFEDWKSKGKNISELEQNPELKSIMLAETPWADDAKSEDEQKKKISLLFNLKKLSDSQSEILKKLTEKQKSSGAFGWFDGSGENEYITRHIVAGFGHLKQLGAIADGTIDTITSRAIPFLDKKFMEQTQSYIQKDNKKMIFNPYNELHYLYARSFFIDDNAVSKELKERIALCLSGIKQNWLQLSLYEKGMAALVLNRFEEKAFAKKILLSLKETSSGNTDWGMYWIENKAGWYWYQAPIETQALLIEAFTEIDNDTKSADAMKVWLLKNKQRKNWPSTKSTTEAIYALLMHGSDWLSVKDNTIIKIGEEKIVTKKLSENDKEAETGYIKMQWKPEEINSAMAELSIENKSKVPGYGALYWQYFEDIDQIKASTSPLSVSKTLLLNQNGKPSQQINSQTTLKPGDLVTVRLVITAKEDAEYVHLKDLRASCFEPVDVLSGYNRKDGLGFYRSTRDVATHFFFDTIAKGTYVLEYDVRVNNTGDFSGGMANIESMYAPEFAGHSKGNRIKVTGDK